MFLLFFLFIDLYFLIPEVITHILIPNAELVIPIGIPTKEACNKRVINIIQNSTNFLMFLTH